MKKAPLIIFVSVLGISTLLFVIGIIALGAMNIGKTGKNDAAGVVIISTPTPVPVVINSAVSIGTKVSTPTPASKPTSTLIPAIRNTFKDGTYADSVNYSVERNAENIKVILTLSGDKVTDVSIVNTTSDPQSEQYQTRFEYAYKSLVVGKKITDVNLSRVAGASETTFAFMEAINNIENAAKA